MEDVLLQAERKISIAATDAIESVIAVYLKVLRIICYCRIFIKNYKTELKGNGKT
jgi:hypothetical protein